MLIALRGRANNSDDLLLDRNLREMAQLVGVPEATLIRDSIQTYLTALRPRWNTKPYSLLRRELLDAASVFETEAISSQSNGSSL